MTRSSLCTHSQRPNGQRHASAEPEYSTTDGGHFLPQLSKSTTALVRVDSARGVAAAGGFLFHVGKCVFFARKSLCEHLRKMNLCFVSVRNWLVKLAFGHRVYWG